MSQNGKRKASEDLQEPSSKRQRHGELAHAGTGNNPTVPANTTGQPTTASTSFPANVAQQPITTIYGSMAGQAATRGQVSMSQAPRGQTTDDAAGIGGAVDSNEGARADPQDGSAGPKRKRRASSPAAEEPGAKQSARGQKRAGLQEAGLNDKEKGTVQQREGQLYCMHPIDKKWVPAVFHSAIRADLIAAASARGSYSVERARGALENDVTSYLESQRNWSGERQHWPRIRHNILNRHERNGWRDDYHGQRAQVWIHTDGRMVIDHDRNPIYKHPDLPDTLSSAIEGWYLEAVMRLDSRILRETIRARLPDARRPLKSRRFETESMYALTAISNKRLRFRHDEGLVAWDSRAVSTEMNSYFRSFIPQASLDRNSNEGGRGLSQTEREHGKSLGKGKGGGAKKGGASSSCTTTPDQATAITRMTTESEGATPAQASQPAHGGSMLPQAGNFASPSPLVHTNGQQVNRSHQAGQPIDPSAIPFLPDQWFNAYHTQASEPIPSTLTQGAVALHGNVVGAPPPLQSNGTTISGTRSPTTHQTLQNQFASQNQQLPGPRRPEQPKNRVGTSIPNVTRGQTSHRAARAGGPRRGRARWRNDDPPVYNGALMRPNGGVSAGNPSHDPDNSSESSRAHGYKQATPAATNASNGERGRPSGRSADNVGVEIQVGCVTSAGVIPESTSSTDNLRAKDSVQQSENPAEEAPSNAFDHPLVEDDQWSLSGENPFQSHDSWPTALDLELCDIPQLADTYVDQNGSGNGLETTPNDTAGPGPTRQVYYDGSAPLQDGQQNTVWRLDDNGFWVLEETPGETIRNQAVDTSDNTANRQLPADTNGRSLASATKPRQLHQKAESPKCSENTPVLTTSTAPYPTQPTPSSAVLDQPTIAGISMLQDAAPSDNAFSYPANVPPATQTGQAQTAERIEAHNAIPANNFQYATIQTLLAPTRRAFIAAFQDESWRIYVPLNFVPPTDRHLSYLGVFEQLSMDFWDIWTSRFGIDADVPPLATPSLIDDFSAAVLLGLPEQTIQESPYILFPASGALGTSIYTHLLDDDMIDPKQIVLISRHPYRIDQKYSAKGVTTRKADYNDTSSLKGVFDDISVLVLISYPSIEYHHHFEVKRDELGEATARIVQAYPYAPAGTSEYLNMVILLSGPHIMSIADILKELADLAGLKEKVKITRGTRQEFAEDAKTQEIMGSHGPKDPARFWTSTFKALGAGECAIVTGELKKWLERRPEDLRVTVRTMMNVENEAASREAGERSDLESFRTRD